MRGPDIIISHGSSNSREVAILIKKGVHYTPHAKIIDPLGRYIILKAEIRDKFMSWSISMHQTTIKTVLNSLPICNLVFILPHTASFELTLEPSSTTCTLRRSLIPYYSLILSYLS